MAPVQHPLIPSLRCSPSASCRRGGSAQSFEDLHHVARIISAQPICSRHRGRTGDRRTLVTPPATPAAGRTTTPSAPCTMPLAKPLAPFFLAPWKGLKNRPANPFATPLPSWSAPRWYGMVNHKHTHAHTVVTHKRAAHATPSHPQIANTQRDRRTTQAAHTRHTRTWTAPISSPCNTDVGVWAARRACRSYVRRWYTVWNEFRAAGAPHLARLVCRATGGTIHD